MLPYTYRKLNLAYTIGPYFINLTSNKCASINITINNIDIINLT